MTIVLIAASVLAMWLFPIWVAVPVIALCVTMIGYVIVRATLSEWPQNVLDRHQIDRHPNRVSTTGRHPGYELSDYEQFLRALHKVIKERKDDQEGA